MNWQAFMGRITTGEVYIMCYHPIMCYLGYPIALYPCGRCDSEWQVCVSKQKVSALTLIPSDPQIATKASLHKMHLA